MNGATYLFGVDPRDSLRGTLLLSIALHVLLAVAALFYTSWGFHFGGRWGQSAGKGSATKINAVSYLPGVPLPAPMRMTPSTLATENPGLYKTEPVPKPPPSLKETEIPKFKNEVKQHKPLRINKRIQKEHMQPPENAIPYGVGGKPMMSYSQFTNSAGGGGLSIGEGNFGDRFPWYVTAVRNRISSNWLMAMISPDITRAPRVYVSFDVARDGTINNVHITQSSGIAEVDRSALRAVLASSPLPPLPPNYSGNKVVVDFYFDFHR